MASEPGPAGDSARLRLCGRAAGGICVGGLRVSGPGASLRARSGRGRLASRPRGTPGLGRPARTRRRIRPDGAPAPRRARPLLVAASAGNPPGPAVPRRLLASRLGRVDPAIFEVAKRHDDLRPRRALPAGTLIIFSARGGMPDSRRGPAVAPRRTAPSGSRTTERRRPSGAVERHHEEITLVVEEVLAILELRKRPLADRSSGTRDVSLRARASAPSRPRGLETFVSAAWPNQDEGGRT